MSGRLSKKPWPDVAMADVFHVNEVGTTLALAAPDPALQTRFDDGSPDGALRASVAGDVLSRVPSVPPSWEGRPAGANGPYEQSAANGAVRVYSPNGTAEGFVYWKDVPNE